MNPHHTTKHTTLYHGNNLHILPTLPDNSVHSIVTDPPYELGFMGKKWDSTGIAYSVDLWRECLRVLKPGGHLCAFGGTRTYHRMAVAIEDAGFDIRDSLHWIYGSGFPKSLDVSKAIDKRGGNIAGFEQFRDAVKTAMKSNNISRSHLQDALGNFMLSHYLTAGSQPAVPNWRDYQIIRDTVGLGDMFDHLFAHEAEREVVGTKTSGIANKDEGPRHTIGAGQAVEVAVTAPATDAARQWDGWGTALKPAHEPIVLARKPFTGTVAANVLQHGTGALNIDSTRIGRAEGDISHAGNRTATFGTQDTVSGGDGSGGWQQNDAGRWPANVIVDDTISDDWARYFYCAKPSKQERNAGLDGLPERVGGSMSGAETRPGKPTNHPIRANFHPTVKPLALMQWLIRLVTPPDGTVLDPFAGSGTTLAAATLQGIHSIGIELTDDYLPIITARTQWAEQQHTNQPKPQPTLFDNDN